MTITQHIPNETIQTLLNHRTTRHFKQTKPFPTEHFDWIVKALQQAPSWMNGQHYSVVAITDNALKEKLAQLSPRNPHLKTCSIILLFVLDMTMQQLCAQKHQTAFRIEQSQEALLIATTDASLAMQNAIIASESLGYGTVCVGGVRSIVQDVLQLVDLPKYTYPLCALCIGEIDDNIPVEKIKPRIDKTVKIHTNRYKKATIDAINVYNDVMTTFADSRETQQWSEKFANYYVQNPNGLTNDALQQQGF